MSTQPPNQGPWGDPSQWSGQEPYGPPQGGPAPQWGAPPAGYGMGPQQGPSEAPQTIRTAVMLMYVGAAVTLVSFLLAFTQTEEIRDQVREDNPTFTEDEVDTAVSAGLTFAVVIGVVAVGLWIWMAIMNGQGKKWARVVATVLGGLNIFFTGIGLVGGAAVGQAEGSVNLIFSLASLGLAIVILILLYQPVSSAYYEAVSRQKMGQAWGY